MADLLWHDLVARSVIGILTLRKVLLDTLIAFSNELYSFLFVFISHLGITRFTQGLMVCLSRGGAF